jgi:GNAT superfamily N-acetyltransferase
MGDLEIRAAVPDDIPSLCRLYFTFHEYHVRHLPDRLRSVDEPGVFDTAGLAHDLQGILGDARAAILVAQKGGAVIGLAEVHLKADDPDPRRISHRFAHLQSLVIQEGHRKRGAGDQLLRAVEGWARAHGASEIRLDTWEFPGDPVAYYEARGYRTLRRQMIRKF